MVFGEDFTLQTRGFSDVKNITDEVQEIITKSGIENGLVNVFAVGSTASVSTMEFEPELVADIAEQLEKMVPSTLHTRHSETWGDENGFSHIRATLMGPSVTIPFTKGRMVLGKWQQVVIIDHDNRPRMRTVFVQVMGE